VETVAKFYIAWRMRWSIVAQTTSERGPMRGTVSALDIVDFHLSICRRMGIGPWFLIVADTGSYLVAKFMIMSNCTSHFAVSGGAASRILKLCWPASDVLA